MYDQHPIGASPRHDYRSDEDGTILAHNYILHGSDWFGRSKKGGDRKYIGGPTPLLLNHKPPLPFFFAKIIFWGRNTKPICRLIICIPYNIWKRSNHFYKVLIKNITWALFWRLSKKKYQRLHTVLLIMIPKHSCVWYYFFLPALSNNYLPRSFAATVSLDDVSVEL